MHIWTIQPLNVWETLQRDGAVYVDEMRLPSNYVPDSYQWLVAQLIQRVPGYPGTLPWWAYCRKPDLRSHRHLQSGPQIRMELEIADTELLSFPCWAWSRVFSSDYLAFTEGEYRAWSEPMRRAVPDVDQWRLPEPCRTELETSWHRLFSVDLPRCSWDPERFVGEPDCREAVFGRLRSADVRAVTHFAGLARRFEP